MAKPTKTSSQDFMAQRRKAIAEMANKRRQQQHVRGSAISVADSASKITVPFPLRGATPPSQS